LEENRNDDDNDDEWSNRGWEIVMVLAGTKEEGCSSINDCHLPWSLVGLVLLLFVVVAVLFFVKATRKNSTAREV
jgi:hypothetical protein